MLTPSHRSFSILTISVALCSFALSACATSKKHDEEMNALREQLAEAKAQLNSANERLGSMETRVSRMNEKFDATRTTLETYLANQRVQVPVVNHPSEDAGAPVTQPTTPKDPDAGYANDEAVKEYRKAMVLFQAGKFPESVLAFSGFVEKFPDHALAGAAQFHVGESYLRQKEYKLAIQEFQRVLTSYDRSSHVPDTLRDLADAEEKVNRKEEAAKHRQLLMSMFPSSPAAAAMGKGEGASAEKKAESADAPAKASTAAAPAKTPANPGALDEPPPPTAPLGAASPAPLGAATEEQKSE